MGITGRRFCFAAILWLSLALPDLGARYSFGWDSSQFDRAVSDFDITRHQPHPPGYPLWVLALRGLSPVVGNPNRAQVVLALAFTLAALWFFHALARGLLGHQAALSATVLLAFSPVVCLNARSSQVYAVDLFLFCFGGWLAAGLCSGRSHLAAPGVALVAITVGFRPSGAAFVAPLLCFALWRCAGKRPFHAAAAVLAGAACLLAWLAPTALLTGGFRALAALNHAQMVSSFRKTSIFFGARPIVHARMLAEVSLYFAMALCVFIPALAASRRPRDQDTEPRQAWATPLFFFLWMAPNLVLLYFFHCPQPGYILPSLPPLALLLAWRAQLPLKGTQWTAAGLAVALLAGYFPYERFMRPESSALPFLLLRSTPRVARLIETSQHDIRTFIDSMPGRPEGKLVVCLRSGFEAPNIRTVTYDFPDVTWAAPGSGSLFHSPANLRSVAWLCDRAGPSKATQAQYPGARRIGGNALYSFWTLSVDDRRLEEVLKAVTGANP